MFWNTWNCIYQRFIFSYSKPFINFAAISEVLMPWKDIFNEKVLLRLSSFLKFSQNLKRHEDDSNSTTPFDIYLPYIFKALDIVNIGVGSYCFIHSQGNARSQLAR